MIVSCSILANDVMAADTHPEALQTLQDFKHKLIQLNAHLQIECDRCESKTLELNTDELPDKLENLDNEVRCTKDIINLLHSSIDQMERLQIILQGGFMRPAKPGNPLSCTRACSSQ